MSKSKTQKLRVKKQIENILVTNDRKNPKALIDK